MNAALNTTMIAAEVLAVMDDAAGRLEKMCRDFLYRESISAPELRKARIAVAAMAEREAALVAERDSLRKRSREMCQALVNAVGADGPCNAEDAAAKLVSERDALVKEVEALREDRDRLNWLDANNVPKRMGWEVGIAPAGNVSVSSVVFLGSEPVTIRGAIDAARAEVA